MFKSILAFLGFRAFAKKSFLGRHPYVSRGVGLLPVYGLRGVLPIVGGIYAWKNRDRIKGLLPGRKAADKSEVNGIGAHHHNDVLHP